MGDRVVWVWTRLCAWPHVPPAAWTCCTGVGVCGRGVSWDGCHVQALEVQIMHSLRSWLVTIRPYGTLEMRVIIE